MAISDDLNSIRTHLEDDYTALEQLGVSVEDRNIENIKDMANQIYAKFPKTSYAEGSNITLSNTLKGKLDFEDGIVGYGDTEQETLEGYNLVGLVDGTYSANGITVVVENGKATVSGTATKLAVVPINIKDSITITNGKTYSLYGFNSTSNSNMAFRPISSDGVFQVDFSTTNNVTSINFSASTVTITTVGIRVASGVTIDNLVCYPMLIIGSDTTKDYEPYVGGTASPNPSYPQEIEVVRGKNRLDDSNLVLFNSNKYISTTNYSTQGKIAVKPSTTYSLIYISGTGTITDNGLYEFDKDNNKTTITATNTYTSGYLVKVFKTLSTTKTMSFYAGSSDTYTSVEEFLQAKELMLLEGDYSSQSIPSYLPYNTLEVVERGLNSFDYSVIDNNHISMANPNNATISFNDNGFTITPITQGDNYTISGMDITNATIRSDLRKYLVEVKPNTTYTFIMDISYSVLAGLSAYYSLIDSDYKVTGFRTSTQNSKTIDSNNRRYFVNITTSADTKYLGFRYGNQGTTAVTYSNIMLVEGTYNADTLPTFEEYQTPQTYQLSLGEYELYADSFIERVSEGNYNLVSAYEKKRINVNPNTIDTSSTNTTRLLFANVMNNPCKYTTLNKCNMLSFKSNWLIDEEGFYNDENTRNIVIRINKSTIGTTLNEVSNYLQNNNLYVICKLVTPIETPITDTTLINQLEEWYNSHSFTGTTIIEIDGQLPLIIKVRALKGE